jgi:hypothetical protein
VSDREQFVDEDTYFAVREEQLVQKLERSGYTRRQILKNGAAGALLLAGAGRLVSATRARAATTTTSPIVKPLPSPLPAAVFEQDRRGARKRTADRQHHAGDHPLVPVRSSVPVDPGVTVRISSSCPTFWSCAIVSGSGTWTLIV